MPCRFLALAKYGNGTGHNFYVIVPFSLPQFCNIVKLWSKSTDVVLSFELLFY